MTSQIRIGLKANRFQDEKEIKICILVLEFHRLSFGKYPFYDSKSFFGFIFLEYVPNFATKSRVFRNVNRALFWF